jgi:hypothetical protein
MTEVPMARAPACRRPQAACFSRVGCVSRLWGPYEVKPPIQRPPSDVEAAQGLDTIRPPHGAGPCVAAA